MKCGITYCANSSKLCFVAAGLAQSWPNSRNVPNPPDSSTSDWIFAIASSGVPITAKPSSSTLAMISSGVSPRVGPGRAARG